MQRLRERGTSVNSKPTRTTIAPKQARSAAPPPLDDGAARIANAHLLAEELRAIADRAVLVAEAVENGLMSAAKAAACARFDRWALDNLAAGVLAEVLS